MKGRDMIEPQKNTWLTRPSEVTEGDRIVLPKGMTLRQGAEVLLKKAAEEEKVVDVYETISCFPLEGAVAFDAAMRQRFGWVTATDAIKQGLFGPVKVPPTTISVEVDFGKYVDVLWGAFTIPTVTGQLQMDAEYDPRDPKFVIAGKVLKKDIHIVKELAEMTREMLKKHSIYKGKALRLRTDDDGNFQPSEPPKFLDLSRVDERELVFPETVMEQVRTSLWTPIERTTLVRQHGIPLKRGILFAGPYGVGKTLTGYITAKKAVANGWTYIYLDRVTAFREAVLFARRYAPAVIFAEDIDRILDGERDLKMDDVLNIIDGIDSKGGDLIVILTTNFVKKIDKAMLRPGRLDAVISVTAPDEEAVKKLMRLYGRGLVKDDEDLDDAAKEMSGQIPAIVREVVERSKLYAISNLPEGEDALNIITGKDLAQAARGMKAHRDLLTDEVEHQPSAHERVGLAIRDTIAEHFENGGGKALAEQTATLSADAVLEALGRPRR